MKKLIEYLKKRYTKDWVIVKTYKAKWISFRANEQGYQVTPDVQRTTYYDIKYSKIRNKFTLSTRGEHNKSTKKEYEIALKKLTELNVQLLSETPLHEILKTLEVKFKTLSEIKDILKEKYNMDFYNCIYKKLYQDDDARHYVIFANKSLYFIQEHNNKFRVDNVQKMDIIKDKKYDNGIDLTITGVGFDVYVLYENFKDLESFKTYIDKTLEL